MFREMRKAERKLEETEARQLLARGEYGILSTSGENGYPYGVPVSYFYQEDKIYFHGAKDVGQKLDNIKTNPKVCFTVVGNTDVLPGKFSTKYESVIVFGTATETAGDKQKALEGLIDKYSADFREAGLKYIASAFEKTGVYEIQIEHITAKARR